VNDFRIKYSNNIKYVRENTRLCRILDRAINEDGLIEDYLPKGTSYNPQYNVSTIALMIFLNNRGHHFNVDYLVRSFLRIIPSSGDINYFGRGTNQIFAWGPWFYICTLFGLNHHTSFNYFIENSKGIINSHNIFANTFDPSEQNLWWDYHYASVYQSHLVFWIGLSFTESIIQKTIQKISEPVEKSIIKLHKNETEVIVNRGYKKYLSERGPSIVLLSFDKIGCFFKGPFGPRGDLFGSKNENTLNSVFNHFGLIEVIDKMSNCSRYLSRIGIYINKDIRGLKNLFIQPMIEYDGNKIRFIYRLSRKKKVFWNTPVHVESDQLSISVQVDSKTVNIRDSGSILTPYGIKKVFQTSPKIGKLIIVTFLIGCA
jgi:hypothetical protein